MCVPSPEGCGCPWHECAVSQGCVHVCVNVCMCMLVCACVLCMSGTLMGWGAPSGGCMWALLGVGAHWQQGGGMTSDKGALVVG